MTRKSTSLSIEIIDMIFQYLPKQSLMECRKVSQLWNSYATRHFINHVILYNEKKVLKFLELPLNVTSQVKKMNIYGIPKALSKVLSKKHIQQLMTSVPNLQELEFKNDLFSYDLNDIKLPTSLTCIYFNTRNNFGTKKEHRKYVDILNRYRDTIQKFNMTIEHKLYKNWDIISFFASFPKLIELDVRGMVYKFTCLTDCLPFIQAIPSLKSINIKIVNDINSELISTNKFQHRLREFEELNLIAYNYIFHTLRFIIHNFVGLKKINVTFPFITIKDLDDSTILLEFINFINSLDTYCIDFELQCRMFYQHCLAKIIYNSFDRLPENSQNVSRQLHINLGFIETKKIHNFKLNSFRDYCNRLQRIIKWSFVYYEPTKNQLFKCIESLDKLYVDILFFDITYFPNCYISNLYINLFFRFVSSIKSKKVVLKVSNNCRWSNKNVFSEQFNNIVSQFEIQVESIPYSQYNIPLCLNSKSFFQDESSNLDLQFDYCCGMWYPESKTYSIELPLISLKTLNLEVPQLMLEPVTFNCKCKLVVDTNTTTHLFEFSKYSFATINASEIDTEKYLYQIHIKIHSVQKLYLHDLTFKKNMIIPLSN